MADPRLEVIGAPGSYPLPAGTAEFTIGRRQTNDLPLDGSEISRLHAAIIRGADGRYALRDCGSRFGTFVNEKQITEHILSDGDRIRLGQHGGRELLFLHEQEVRSTDKATTTRLNEIRQLAALIDGLRALGSGRVLEEVLAMVVDSAIEVAHAERGFVMLANESGDLEFTLARARGGLALHGSDFKASRKIPQDVFRTGVAQMVQNLEGEPGHLATARIGIRTVLCVPLRLVRFAQGPPKPTTEECIGVLYLDSQAQGTLASPWIGATVETLATEAAVAIENARLYRQSLDNARSEEELRIAAEIQRALLPKRVPPVSRVTASAAMAPTRLIGGDFFDYLQLPGAQLGFVLGDVAGKGPPAALLSALMQGMLAFAAEGSKGPADTITRLNRALVRREIEARFVTLFYGALGEDGALTYCNAGHNPPLVLGGGRSKTLTTGGCIVGAFDAATYKEETIRLAPGELVVVFSDGISEALNAFEEEYGDDRIREVVERYAARPPNEIVDGLFADVRHFCGLVPQNDDMTALVIRFG